MTYHTFGAKDHKLLISTPSRAVAMEVCKAYKEGTYVSYIKNADGKEVGNSVEGWTDGHVTVSEAIQNALTFLESLGYGPGGDVHDDLAIALTKVRRSPVPLGEEFL
jgi:hypothetical protein